MAEPKDTSADTVSSKDVRPVVTIFEHYGAGAETIGRRVAEALGLPFHSQAFSSEELEEEAALEQNVVLADVFSAMGGAYRGFEGRDVVATQQQKYDLVMENNRRVREAAEEGGVIVGRNGAVVLANRPRTLHVLLTGAPEDRVERAAREAGVPREQAAKRQKREDDVRAQMSKVLYGWDPRQPERYDIVINTSRLAVDVAADAVLGALRGLTR